VSLCQGKGSRFGRYRHFCLVASGTSPTAATDGQFKPFKQFNRCAPFKTFEDISWLIGHIYRDSRALPLPALGFRDQGTLRSIDPRLCGDVQPRLSFCSRARPNVIAQSFQLIAGRTAHECNQCKGRQGAFWEETVTMPRLSKPTDTCIVVWCTLT
jgi:hypothetical protein